MAMLAAPTPAELPNLSPAELLVVYRELALRNLATLRPTPATPADLVNDVAVARLYWEQLDAQAVLGGYLGHGVDLVLNVTQKYYHRWIGRPDLPDSTVLTRADLAVLTTAVGRAESALTTLSTVPNMYGGLIRAIFGKDAEGHVLKVLHRAGDVLRTMLDGTLPAARPEVDVWPPSRSRFVLSTTLPERMKALSTRSATAPYIRLRPDALRGPDADAAAWALVPPLVHEATHIIEDFPTIDYAYRGTPIFRALPLVLRAHNAAHYEQLSIEFLGGQTGSAGELSGPGKYLGWDTTEADPADFTTVERANALLQLKVARAWVKSFNMSSFASAADKAMQSQFVKAVGAPFGAIGPNATQALFDDLASGADDLMSTVTDEPVIVTGGEYERPCIALNGEILAALPPEVGAADLADWTVRTLTDRQKSLGLIAFPRNLQRLIEISHQFEKPALSSELLKFYARWGG